MKARTANRIIFDRYNKVDENLNDDIRFESAPFKGALHPDVKAAIDAFHTALDRLLNVAWQHKDDE